MLTLSKNSQEAAVHSVLQNRFYLNISQNSGEKTTAMESLFHKVAGLRFATLLKRYSSTDVFL